MKTEGQIEYLSFLTPREKNILIKNGINTFEELLYFFPFRHEEAPSAKQIQDITPGQKVSISGIIIDIQAKTGYHHGTKFTKAIIADNTDSIEAIWWNMPYISKTLSVDQKIILTGTVAERDGKIFLNNPKIEKVKNLSINADSTLFADGNEKPRTPVYPELQRGKNKERNFYISKILERAFKSPEFKKIKSIIPEEVSERLHLGTRQNAILRKHRPIDDTDTIVTNKYFAFEEIFVMQVYREQEKKLRADSHAYKIKLHPDYYKELENIIPFKLTNGQQKVLDTILNDIQQNKPMSRLVEGDVGSGKTILALAAALATVETEASGGKHLQVAYIAPTEILASQHFEFFIKTLAPYPHLNIALLTSSGAKIFPSKLDREKWTQAPKSRVKKLLDDGRLNIVIGTHALFNKNILFEHLGLVIIDEQHRFGVKQRLALIEKHKTSATNKKSKYKNQINLDTEEEIEEQIKHLPIPHLLSMSATPIPRTLALTIYGDLDLSILDELPPGRRRAETKICNKFNREEMYNEMRHKLEQGKQSYVIAPKISEQEIEYGTGLKIKSSVESEEKRIKKYFPNFKTGILHGKLPKAEKEKVIEKFYKKEIDILISTTVVEVGVSVPNATFILIENADTFGLAQLHQLRGRVERSTDHSLCFLATETESENSLRRLEALVKSNNGFELAEVDLSERGAGSLIGNRQSGLTDIGMEAIKNRKLVEVAKEEARKVLEMDENLNLPQHKLLKEKIDQFTFHEE
jgi:ATP-dependent DNA helicase RecG